ncbi:predicted protein [Ostreococcus lucimarinus CCE9901]|uniref:Uncharacterized protein n=1 Tax=Ostreococcus lucimarinus (strain CCE9901) TaxID=436017 RepID=A4RQV2_OSTLU|nr:predicted protein [Ostreococcus lucimarinus CCE9901]ABO94089.1 predicted protein [Ostreococcus lucimarinus CCE9901]|eukprot:XP_001415797.1 predicted protein [Ostreococcus lucimarinus CCE9901]
MKRNSSVRCAIRAMNVRELLSDDTHGPPKRASAVSETPELMCATFETPRTQKVQ